MAVFTPLKPKELQKIAACFGLQGQVKGRPVGDGSVNTIYALETSQGEFFLRFEEAKNPDEVAHEIAFQVHIAGCGFPCPVPLRLVAGSEKWGAYLLPFRQSVVSLFPAASGQTLPLSRYEIQHVEQVGELVGKLHTAGRDFSERLADRFSLDRLQEIFARSKDRMVRDYPGETKGLEEELAFQRQMASKVRSLPQGVVHGDLFADNLFFSGQSLCGLIDFDAAARREMIFDLATAANALCFAKGQFCWDFIGALLAGYQRLRPLGEAEWNLFVVVWRLSSLRFTLTRIQDFHLRQAPQSGLIQRDFRDFYQRLEIQREIREMPRS